jgi:3-oxoacyl-[acyl-carrier-protein] synthase II
MNHRRVAVTGLGLVCALGLDRESAWQAMCLGRCGIGELTLFDGAGYRSRMVAEVPAYDGAAHFSRWERRRYSRADQFAVMAAAEALDDAGLLDSAVSRESIGVFFGVGTGDLLRSETYYAELLARGVRRAQPSKVANYLNGGSADPVARRFGLLGPRACINSACSSSAMAIGYGAGLIRSGRILAAACGGGDSLCRTALSGFNALRVVDVDPCRPFDASRNGMTIGEAGAVLILEDMDHALARRAHVYAEIAGFAAYCEAHHPTAPEPEGLAVAALIRAALAASGVSPDAVDHVNAHGTGTPLNDSSEALGIRRVFGDRGAEVPVTAIKSMVGHCLGAAGAVEAVTLALTVDRGVIPPTVHHSRTDAACPITVVANQGRTWPVGCAVSTSLAFGGNDAAIVMRRVRQAGGIDAGR